MAIIITIIVLLILAIVSIRLVMNDGIIGKAEYGTQKYSSGEEKEQIAFAWASLSMDKNTNKIISIDKDNFKEELNKNGYNAEIEHIKNKERNFFLVTFSKTNNRYMVDEEGNIEEKKVEPVQNYEYTGSEKEIILAEGKYLIECWGAQGGGENGGKGAYVCGELTIDKTCTLYAYIGSTTSNSTGGYNGGGSGSLYGGGGSTDIRLINGDYNNLQSLASRIMVAAGGGGSGGDASTKYPGGYGGALIGEDGTGDDRGYGGTQVSGGKIATGGCLVDTNAAKGSFGIGGSGGWCNESLGEGGAGYYGGSSGGGKNNNGSAGGGSSYVSGYEGCIAIKSVDDITPKVNTYTQISDSYHYSGFIFDNIRMIAGNEEMPFYGDNSSVIGNSGNGHLRIKRIY